MPSVSTTQDQSLNRGAEANSNLSVSMVIPTKDRVEPLCQTIESIAAQTIKPLEIIIIDQSANTLPRSSVEQTWKKLGPPEKYSLKYVSDGSLSGSSTARNVGIDLARGEVILFLDDDVILEPDFIERLLEPYSDAAVGGVGGVITNYDPPAARDRRFRALFFRGPFHDDRQYFYWNASQLRNTAPAPIDRLGGGLMSFRREVCKALRFDPNFTGYSLGEDVDFSFNAARSWKVMIQPKARLVHLRSPGTRPREDWRLHEMRSYAYLYRKNWQTGFKNRLAFFWLRVGFLLLATSSAIRQSSTEPLRQWRVGFAKP